MTESPTPNKFAKWKRPLIGGFLSTLITLIGIAIGLSNDSLFFLIGQRFMGLPIFILVNLLHLDEIIIPGIILTLAIWFLIGALITHFVRKNLPAVAYWLLSLVVSGFFAAWVCIFC